MLSKHLNSVITIPPTNPTMKPKTRVTVAHVKAPPKATERVFPFSDKFFTSSDASTHLALRPKSKTSQHTIPYSCLVVEVLR